ncbi:PTS lactose/cellobiose transporter subunit IIA [Mammaliicoccus sp. Dog046]|uniref:PTS lactose/cellobiose transporter subunit IIA n=1 Tax=Mammaliicoccus sp. Dog046 TaxID=3034233 RepID=UPI002B25EF96|nr:PTS lactose/cellobiose transporter subunit IIA [Mammaliicoccus sp. Dog046]WQK84396.1 PTS lactose/cellobiose transporter subunit IIA [Mammaliicoccus sp. Dog046]
MNREENMMLGFTIVAIAGDARREVMSAMEKAKQGQLEEARKHIESANEFITEAHKEQTQCLAQEASGESSELSFIMVHGQDHLMTTMALRDAANYIIDIYEQLQSLKK